MHYSKHNLTPHTASIRHPQPAGTYPFVFRLAKPSDNYPTKAKKLTAQTYLRIKAIMQHFWNL